MPIERVLCLLLDVVCRVTRRCWSSWFEQEDLGKNERIFRTMYIKTQWYVYQLFTPVSCSHAIQEPTKEGEH